MTDKYISFYFDTSSQPFTYGVCVWSGSYETETQTTMVQTLPGAYQPRNFHTLKTHIELLDVGTGAIALRDLAEFVSALSKDHLTASNRDKIILEKLPETTVLQKTLKKDHRLHNVELVERDSPLSEQIAKYLLMINRDTFYIDERYIVEPDLIFDEVASVNLIDPIFTDEQDTFPLTQALLVGCQYLETVYRRSTGALVAGKLQNPFSSDGRFPQRRDFGSRRF